MVIPPDCITSAAVAATGKMNADRKKISMAIAGLSLIIIFSAPIPF
jgi:hypothetical protein